MMCLKDVQAEPEKMVRPLKVSAETLLLFIKALRVLNLKQGLRLYKRPAFVQIFVLSGELCVLRSSLTDWHWQPGLLLWTLPERLTGFFRETGVPPYPADRRAGEADNSGPSEQNQSG